jgi:ParB/RepB/Spo0J family partition protein
MNVPITECPRVSLSQIRVSERFRKDYGDMSRLVDSIREIGLLQPLGVTKDFELIFGGRRYAAAKTVGLLEVPYVFVSECDTELTLRMMEFEENDNREPMTWQERCLLIDKIHSLTDREKSLAGERWSRKATGSMLGISEGNVQYCVTIAAHLANKESKLWQATSLTEALTMLLQQKEDEANARLAAMSLSATLPPTPTPTTHDSILQDILQSSSSVAEDISAEREKVRAELAERMGIAEALGREVQAQGKCIACNGTGKSSKGSCCLVCAGTGVAKQGDEFVIPLSRLLLNGDALSILSTIPEESVDHVYSDPPYGINMANLQQTGTGMDVSRTVNEHDVQENLQLLADAIPLLARVLRPAGFCLLFCDVVHFSWLCDRLREVGLKVQNWPLVWCKTTPCLNQAAQYNWTKATESVVVARKGNAILARPQPNNYILTASDAKDRFSHPFAKPTALHEWVLRAIAIHGQIVLDPFMGSGTIPCAAAKLGLSPRGIELVPEHFHEACNQLIVTYKEILQGRNVRFA